MYANDSTDHIDIQSLLQVPDDKGLRVWTDKNMHWKTFKSDCFLVNDYEEPLKWSETNNGIDNPKICGASHLVVSEDVPPIQDTLKSVTLKSGSTRKITKVVQSQ